MALRAEFLSDSKGVDFVGSPLGDPVGSVGGSDLTSIALTLNYKPVPSIKIQPEVRFDHTSAKSPVGSPLIKSDRVIIGAGISYLF